MFRCVGQKLGDILEFQPFAFIKGEKRKSDFWVYVSMFSTRVASKALPHTRSIAIFQVLICIQMVFPSPWLVDSNRPFTCMKLRGSPICSFGILPIYNNTVAYSAHVISLVPTGMMQALMFTQRYQDLRQHMLGYRRLKLCCRKYAQLWLLVLATH